MWQQVLTNLISIESLMALVLGVVGGMIIGALPGLNATMAISLLIPITYSMAPHAAFIMMMAVYNSTRTYIYKETDSSYQQDHPYTRYSFLRCNSR